MSRARVDDCIPPTCKGRQSGSHLPLSNVFASCVAVTALFQTDQGVCLRLTTNLSYRTNTTQIPAVVNWPVIDTKDIRKRLHLILALSLRFSTTAHLRVDHWGTNSQYVLICTSLFVRFDFGLFVLFWCPFCVVLDVRVIVKK